MDGGNAIVADQRSRGRFRRGCAFVIESTARHRRNLDRLERKFDANLTQGFDRGNKSFIIKGRGSSVVEQPIRNRQVASSTLALGSKNAKKTKGFLKPVTYLLSCIPVLFHCSFEVRPWRSLCLWLQRCPPDEHAASFPAADLHNDGLIHACLAQVSSTGATECQRQ
jgi:hypothetical protein